MGEIADMMVEGLLDVETGEYIGDENRELFGTEAPGFPRCGGDPVPQPSRERVLETVTLPVGTKVICPYCGKRSKAQGLQNHVRDKHPEKQW